MELDSNLDSTPEAESPELEYLGTLDQISFGASTISAEGNGFFGPGA
jgi:hypothetical protein